MASEPGNSENVIDPHLEAEYNNRLKVPEHPAVMAEWRRKAQEMRAKHAFADLDLTYGVRPRHRLDLFWPDVRRAAPLAMFIHGGYWAALDKSWFSHLAAGFLANGVAVAIPSYDLCPDVPLARVVDDVRHAAAYVMRTYDRDLYATGHSAGGHMAAMLLATDWAARGMSQRVTGCCAISGLFDLTPLVRTSINGPLGLDDAEAARLSPVRLARPVGPVHAFVGEHEGVEYARQSQSIADAWGGSWTTIAGANHFTAIAPLEDGASAMMRTIVSQIATTRC